MSLDLSYRDRNRPVELVSEMLNGVDLLVAFHNFIVEGYDPIEVFGEERLKQYIRDHMEPDDVFSDEVLKAWAEENGFKKDAA